MFGVGASLLQASSVSALGFGAPLRSVYLGMVLHGRHDGGGDYGSVLSARGRRVAGRHTPLSQQFDQSVPGGPSWHGLGLSLASAGARAVVGHAVLASSHGGGNSPTHLFSPTTAEALKSRVRSEVTRPGPTQQATAHRCARPLPRGAVGALASSGFIGKPIKAMMRGKALTAPEKACLRRFVAGGLWTCAAFDAAGYDTNPPAPRAANGLTQSFIVFGNAAVQRLPQQGSRSWAPNWKVWPSGGRAGVVARPATLSLCPRSSPWNSLRRGGPQYSTTAGKSSRPRTATCQRTSPSLPRRLRLSRRDHVMKCVSQPSTPQGVWRDGRVACRHGVEAVSVRNIKSLQALDDIVDGSSARDVFGNERADEIARKGLGCTLPTNPTWPPWPFITNWSSAWPRRRHGPGTVPDTKRGIGALGRNT